MRARRHSGGAAHRGRGSGYGRSGRGVWTGSAAAALGFVRGVCSRAGGRESGVLRVGRGGGGASSGWGIAAACCGAALGAQGGRADGRQQQEQQSASPQEPAARGARSDRSRSGRSGRSHRHAQRLDARRCHWRDASSGVAVVPAPPDCSCGVRCSRRRVLRSCSLLPLQAAHHVRRWCRCADCRQTHGCALSLLCSLFPFLCPLPAVVADAS